MPVEFRCAECGTVYEVDDDLAGKRIRCRECDSLGRGPTVAVRPTNSAKPEKKPAIRSLSDTSTSTRNKPGIFISKRMFLGVAATIFFILLGVTVWVLFVRSRHENPSPNPADDYMVRGFQAAQISDFDLAISCYGEAIRLDPTRANAYLGRGASYNEKGMWEFAIKDLSDAIKFDPKSARAYFFRSLSYAELEQHVQAGMDCSQATRLGISGVNPDHQLAVVYAKHGQKYLEQERYPDAHTCFLYAIEHDGNESAFHSGMVIVAMKLQQWPEVIEESQNAIRLGADKKAIMPAMGLAYLSRAQEKLKQGNRQGARADYDAAVQANPDLKQYEHVFAP